jgi:hypothetical protein
MAGSWLDAGLQADFSKVAASQQNRLAKEPFLSVFARYQLSLNAQ